MSLAPNPYRRSVNPALSKTGDSMVAGATIVLGRDPAAAMEAATKPYVDAGVDSASLFEAPGDAHPSPAGANVRSKYASMVGAYRDRLAAECADAPNRRATLAA
jgi:hypothetical protein